MLKLKQIDLHRWEFVHPNGYNDTLDSIDEGCDFYEMGDLKQAEKIFKAVVEEMPDNLDGLHHWALVRDKSGDMDMAKALWEKSVSMGKKAFPPDFIIGEDMLEWRFLDNRPFLRCMHGLGFILLRTGEVERANKIFMEMLKINPNDNQGARALAVDGFFHMCQPEEVLKVCSLYHYDAMPDILYGRALAFFQLGDKKKADSCLKEAIKCLPKVAKEITKITHKKPKFLREGYVRAGGDDQAYLYWHKNNIYWQRSIGSIGWVRTMLGRKGKIKAEIKTGKEDAVYQLKITLKDVKPPIWRRFLVKGDTTLYKLYLVLLEVMGWTGGHLHVFRINGRHYGKPDSDFDCFDETFNEKKFKLKDVVQGENKRFTFEYDFGDGWEHEVLVEKVLPYDKDIKCPVCLEGERACPPEDCGGPGGYEDFLKVIRNPNHPKHKELLEWKGGKFDPEKFGLEEVNKFLKDVGKNKTWFEDFV
jgi:tetratricopeptide (TPR) repeat protein